MGCPSAGQAGILPRYPAKPWSAGQELWRFTGEYAWVLTGTDRVLVAP